ncbi:hypothetical protein EVJ58_g5103 [Rhodofomes roseus]|uniref:BTB domain-containing protein n=1 Tax=Rhodofomes roseus TaxID=34475 RepID=A0A4Y9YGF0_9APHY|nr:hypothetical protein EVJ58_g5103 [Rhodofomes roseus]
MDSKSRGLTPEGFRSLYMASVEKEKAVAEGNIALPPFDNASGDADVVLRSSDGIDFYVHKSTLRIASTFFATMLSLPQADLAGPGLPVIPVTEDSRVLNHVLRILYPVHHPAITKAVDAIPLLHAAEKYQLPSVTLAVEKSLVLLCHMQSQVLDAYAVASSFKLDRAEEVASSAFLASCPTQAEYGENIDMHWRQLHRIDEFTPAMLTMPASSYYNLLKAYQRLTTGRNARTGYSDLMSCMASQRWSPPRDSEPRLVWPTRRSRRHASPLVRDQLFTLEGNKDSLVKEVVQVRASDGTDLYANVHFVRFASPVMAEMLSAAVPSALDGDQAVVGGEYLRRLELPETGETLSALLRLCYPMPDPEVTGPSIHEKVSKVCALLDAALKYKVQRAISFAKQACVRAAEEDSSGKLHVASSVLHGFVWLFTA